MNRLSHLQVAELALALGRDLNSRGVRQGAYAYGIPRGGVFALYALLASSPGRVEPCAYPEQADVFIDDIQDSGATRDLYAERYPGTPFIPLLYKQPGDDWVVFPWEAGEVEGTGGEDIVTRLLQYVGEDPGRGGLIETPRRVLAAWRDWTDGYGQEPSDVLKCFEDGAEGVDEMVVVRDLPFYSHCEHHLAPFFGTATIAYIPSRKIVGLSKLSRLLDIYARRLQVQERLTNQVADALWDNLSPLGVGVLIRARHLCMESRGICKQGHETLTSALRGVLHDEPSARTEFLTLAGGGR